MRACPSGINDVVLLRSAKRCVCARALSEAENLGIDPSNELHLLRESVRVRALEIYISRE